MLQSAPAATRRLHQETHWVTGPRTTYWHRARLEVRMRTSWVFSGALAIFWGAVFGTAFLGLGEEEEKVLVDNKCQCVKVTSRFIPSNDNPDQEILERNIFITVPLTARQNISDPTSPGRTRFVYNLSKLCKKCDQEDNQKVPVGESSMCNDPDEPCYTYNRNRCYTSSTLFSHAGKTTTVEAALTPDSCYLD